MLLTTLIISFILSATGVTITEPVDGQTYDGDWLTVRAIIENENEIPDSVHYCLNGSSAVQIPRLNTDWYTYMGNDNHTGFSESPAPHDNTILWTAPVTSDSHEFPTPVVVNGIVYYPSNTGTDSLYALDAVTGELIWKYHVGVTDDAVTVKFGMLYIASDSVWCLNALTGERVWAFGEADESGSTPVVTDQYVYCADTFGGYPFADSTRVFCLDRATGSVLWSSDLEFGTTSCMAVWNDLVFLPTDNTGSYTSLYALNATSGEIVWQNSDAYDGFWDSSPVIHDGIVYINGRSGIAYAIDALTGETIWESPVWPGAGTITATPAYQAERLYFACQSATNVYFCLDAGSGEIVWSAPGHQHGSSALADGLIFYGNDTNACITALDWENGDLVWSYETGGAWLAGSPSVTDGIMYMAGQDWNLYAFGTGLKFTYLDDLYARVGSNQLIVTSFDDGVPMAADTITFYVSETGIDLKPSNFFDLSASPNPFCSNASISFNLNESGFTTVEIYDLTGRCISNLVENDLSKGYHTVNWSGTDQRGERVSAGLYLCRIQSGGVIETTGLCLLR